LLGHGVCQRFALQILIVIHPLLKLYYFERISRSGQGLGEERVGIKSDRRNQRIQLIIRNFWGFFGRRRGRHHLRLRLLRQCGRDR